MFGRFQRNEDGNFAMLTGLAMIVVVTAIGMAMDMAGMTSRKTKLQSAVDAATLSAALQGGSEDELSEIVDQVMATAFDGEDVTMTIDLQSNLLRVNAEHDYDMMMMGALGRGPQTMNASAEVPIGGAVPIEVAFALDITNSMDARDSSGTVKIEALQTAANELVDTLESRSGPDVRASVVPFSNYVNIGTDATARAQSWLDLSDAEGVVSGGNCSTRTLARPEDCYEEDYDYLDDNGVVVTNQRNHCPDTAYDTHAEICTDRTNVWHGCVGSRVGLDGLMADANALNRIKGVANSTCPGLLRPMTTSMDEVRNSIDTLTTEKNTYIPTGLIWAWRTLTPGAPYPNMSTNPNARRAVVLMTDGKITMYQDPGRHEHYNQSMDSTTQESNDHSRQQIDVAYDRMRALCSAIKAQGIRIYTIGFDLQGSDNRVREELRACASNSSSNFNPDNAAQLSAAFEQIGDSLYDIRLSR